MIASKPVRLLSLALVAAVVWAGIHGIVGGIGLGGDLLGGPSGSERPAAGVRTPAVVEYVLDGDTVTVTTRGGKQVRVRLLGISAPEIPHHGKPGQCYGSRSTRRLKKLLPPGTAVTLISDPTQDRIDAYGRWLRYVETDVRDIARAQILAGAATTRDSGNPPVRHTTYQRTEDRARAAGSGLWTACR